MPSYPTFVPAFEPMNVLVGTAAMFWQPYDPLDLPTLPPDSTDLGEAWGTPWTPVGATHEGLSFQFDRDTNEIMIEETPIAVAFLTNKLTVTAVVTLAEDTLDTMKLAYGGGTITTVAASLPSTYGTRTLTIAPNLETIAFGFEAFNEHSLPRRVMVPTAVSIGTIKTEYRRADDKRMYEVNVQCTCQPEDIVIRDIVAVPA